jgi:hypothetical protein
MLFLKDIFNIILSNIRRHSKWSFFLGFPPETVYVILLSTVHAACPAQHHYLINRISDEQTGVKQEKMCRCVAEHRAEIQGDQKVSVHLMITELTASIWLNLTAWQQTDRAKGTLDSH